MIEVNGSADAVNLLTVHGSKGLEFTYTFFAGCNSHNWEKKKSLPEDFISLIPCSLPSQSNDRRIAHGFFMWPSPGQKPILYFL